VKIIRKTRGRPPKNCSEQPPQKRSRQKIPPTVEDSQESWVPRQTQKRSNEAVAPRKNHRPQRVHTNILASPNTIAVKVIEKGKEVTTPEIKLLAEARIFSHDPARYIIFNEESVPALGASLNVTPGTTIQSIGDVVQAFDILEKDRYFSSHIGSLKERKENENMETDTPLAYRKLVNTSVDCMVKMAHVFHPANPEGIFRATIDAATKKAKMNPSEDTVSALIKRAKEAVQNLPRGSIEKRTALALGTHIFGNNPELHLSKYAKTKANTDLKTLLQGEKLDVKKFRRLKIDPATITK
jgi:hypothetical protein